jgi:hypothetical protein
MVKMKCEGWWEQEGLGRQPMHELTIEFENGRLSGEGVDWVGLFVIRGIAREDTIEIHKQYIGQHSILYRGTTQGEGVYFGDWECNGYVGGRWSICFRTIQGDDQPIQQIQPDKR